jgi:hypothetical protein
MINMMILIALVPVLAYGAPNCTAPLDALAKVKSYISYESRAGLWGRGPEHFSFATSDGDALFLQQEVRPYYDKAQRFVYAFRQGNRLVVTGCPNNSQWTRCAEKQLREAIHKPADTPERLAGPVCDLSFTIPVWHPSPDGPLKRRLAASVLQELMEYGYVDPMEVYVRDFSVSDPELDFYIVDREGKSDLQRCTFDADIRPHCAWHLFGQSSTEELKRDIIALPYRLFPPSTPPDPPRK